MSRIGPLIGLLDRERLTARKDETMTAHVRTLLNEEMSYYRRCIPCRDAAQKSARRIMKLIELHPYLVDQIPFDRLGMIRRESENLSPIPR